MPVEHVLVTLRALLGHPHAYYHPRRAEGRRDEEGDGELGNVEYDAAQNKVRSRLDTAKWKGDVFTRLEKDGAAQNRILTRKDFTAATLDPLLSLYRCADEARQGNVNVVAIYLQSDPSNAHDPSNASESTPPERQGDEPASPSRSVIVGLLLFITDADTPASTRAVLPHFVTMLADTIRSDERAVREANLIALQSSIVKVSRFAEGSLPKNEQDALQDGMPPIGSASVFALGASTIHSIFGRRARACIIFDASGLRFVEQKDSVSSGSSASSDAASAPALHPPSKKSSANAGTPSKEEVIPFFASPRSPTADKHNLPFQSVSPSTSTDQGQYRRWSRAGGRGRHAATLSDAANHGGQRPGLRHAESSVASGDSAGNDVETVSYVQSTSGMAGQMYTSRSMSHNGATAVAGGESADAVAAIDEEAGLVDPIESLADTLDKTTLDKTTLDTHHSRTTTIDFAETMRQSKQQPVDFNDGSTASGSRPSRHGDFEVVLPAGGMLCSYVNSDLSVPVLASHGADADALTSLPGDKVRRAMAGYFASAWRSGHGAQITIEAGAEDRNELRLRKMLGREIDAGGIVCAACVDASVQPAFFMVVTFDDKPIVSRMQALMVEQVGITLANALLRARANAVEYAQRLFIQKVQHELRTPLHAIMGVNETVRYTLETARSDQRSRQLRSVGSNSSSQGRSSPKSPTENIAPAPNITPTTTTTTTGRGPQSSNGTSQNSDGSHPDSVLLDLVDLSSSIAGSADRLSALVDDLVDFSLLQRNDKDANDLFFKRSRAPALAAATGQSVAAASEVGLDDAANKIDDYDGNNDDGETQSVTWSTLVSVLSHTAERCWMLFRRPAPSSGYEDVAPPPPELILSVDRVDHAKMDELLIAVNLECLRRVVWKTIVNAIEYTPDGIVRVGVSHRTIEIPQPGKVSNGDLGSGGRDKKHKVIRSHKLVVKIEDSGCGMRPDFVRDRLFQPYQQEDSDSAGLGLSLTLCRFMMDQMGGYIRAESKEGVGSCFTLSVPLHVSKRRPQNGVPLSPASATLGIVHSSPPSAPLESSLEMRPVVVAFAGFDDPSLQQLQAVMQQQLPTTCRVGTIDLGVKGPLEMGDDISVLVLAPDLFRSVPGQPAALLETLRARIKRKVALPAIAVCSARSQREDLWSGWQDALDTLYGKERRSKMFKVQRPVLPAGIALLQGLCTNGAWCGEGDSAPNATSTIPRSSGAGTPTTPSDSAAAPSVSPPLLESDGDMDDATETVAGTLPTLQAGDQRLYRDSGVGTPTLPPFTVLVVEDNPLNARIITTLLKRAKLRFHEAKDGVEAVEQFKRFLPAVVLLDINMPRMNGFEAAQLMRRVQSPFEHFIVAVTALSAEEDRLRGMEAGIDEWLTKPARLGPLVLNLQARKKQHERQVLEC